VGWSGIASKVGADGSVDGVCIGTNYASDIMYYYHRPARDDPHGYGPVLLAGSEMIRLVQNENLDIHTNPNGGCIIFSEKKQ